MDVATQKNQLRLETRTARCSLSVEERHQACEKAADQFLANCFFRSPCVIAGYWPINEELDPRPLLLRLQERGIQCSLPVVVADDQPLVFREWKAPDLLKRGPFDTWEPSAEQAIVIPDVIIVPLLAFDPHGRRLGYGGGFYDRTLRSLKSRKKHCLGIGYAFAIQQVDVLPATKLDERLDWIVTETFTKAFV